MPEKYTRRKEAPGGFGLPTSAFLSRLTSKTNLWLILAVIFLLLVILTCFGLWGYKNNLVEEKGSLEERFEELTDQRDLAMETNFMELKNGIEDLKKALENRLYSSNLFEMLEELTLPQVQFTGLTTDFSQAKLNLEIEAVNYLTLAKQITAFEEDSRIIKAGFSQVRLETSGRIGSALDIELNPDFLRSRAE